MTTRILYVMSPGPSGSTLLTLLSATHPELATIGEGRFLRVRVPRLNSPDNRDIFRLKYEDLCKRPLEELRRIAADANRSFGYFD